MNVKCKIDRDNLIIGTTSVMGINFRINRVLLSITNKIIDPLSHTKFYCIQNDLSYACSYLDMSNVSHILHTSILTYYNNKCWQY